MPAVSFDAVIPCPVAPLRDFLGTPKNLPQISEPDLELEILNAPERVTEGEVIEFRIVSHGFKQRATNRYTEVSESVIAEEQLQGPLRAWSHRQTLEVVSEQETRLIDEISFEPPGGMLGFVMTAATIEESIREGMEYRYETLREIFGR